MHSLRKELGAGQRPLPETMIALVRLSGSKGNAQRGLELLAAMEKLNYDIRQAWLILVGNLSCLDNVLDSFFFICAYHLIIGLWSFYRGTSEDQPLGRGE